MCVPLQIGAARALIDLSVGENRHCDAIMACNVHVPLWSMLTRRMEDVVHTHARVNSLWVLNNLCSSGARICGVLVDLGESIMMGRLCVHRLGRVGFCSGRVCALLRMTRACGHCGRVFGRQLDLHEGKHSSIGISAVAQHIMLVRTATSLRARMCISWACITRVCCVPMPA